MTRVFRPLVAILIVSLSSTAFAQESKSASLAKQLAAALDAAKLDSIAAKDPTAPDIFCAALYFPNSQLLVVSAKYTVPQLLNDRLNKKEYRDTYIDLNSASVPASKVFIQDAAADGLKAKISENQVGRPAFLALRRQEQEHPVEKVGKQLRSMMSWLQAK